MRTGQTGVAAAFGAALLFGAGTPLAKLLLATMGPWMLAALLYLGSGVGLWLIRRARQSPSPHMTQRERLWLSGAVVSGGIVGPVLLMFGLSRMPASSVSLLLNAEGALTALLAWFVFRENFDRRIALGMLAIVAGGAVLSWPAQASSASADGRAVWPAMAVVGACLAWAIDNNLTRKVSLTDASYLAMVKGLAAGCTNFLLALALGASWPDAGAVLSAGLLGFAAYGASLVLFVVALRHLGTARTGAYFSLAPFFGAALAVGLLGESVTPQMLAAAALMAFGVALHLTERHVHLHTHDCVEHNHEHTHGPSDDHHVHIHDVPIPAGTRHRHAHRHTAITHSHAHFPDAHHQHPH